MHPPDTAPQPDRRARTRRARTSRVALGVAGLLITLLPLSSSAAQPTLVPTLSIPSLVAKGSAVTVSGRALPGASVQVFGRSAGSKDFTVRRTLRTSSAGAWSTTLVLDRDQVTYVKSGSVRSGNALTKVAAAAPSRNKAAIVSPVRARTWKSGVYSGNSPEETAAFAAWRGAPVDLVNAYLPSDTWQQMRDPAYHLYYFGKLHPELRPLYSTALWPATGGSFAQAAAGAYDANFAELARNLVKNGQADAVMRLGWEFNAVFYRWSVNTPADAANYAKAYRHIVTAMRSVKGQHFTFDWNILGGDGGINPMLAYPGDAYVDTIGLDLYDFAVRPGLLAPPKQWQALVNLQYGLKWQADVAAQHGKQISFAEWGLVQSFFNPNSGMNDDPTFVSSFYNWLATHDTAFECYFNVDTLYGIRYGIGTGSQQFPAATATYLKLFGGR